MILSVLKNEVLLFISKFIDNVLVIYLNTCKVVIYRKVYLLTFKVSGYILLVNYSHGSKYHINFMSIKIL